MASPLIGGLSIHPLAKLLVPFRISFQLKQSSHHHPTKKRQLMVSTATLRHCDRHSISLSISQNILSLHWNHCSESITSFIIHEFHHHKCTKLRLEHTTVFAFLPFCLLSLYLVDFLPLLISMRSTITHDLDCMDTFFFLICSLSLIFPISLVPP
jgi:hypothetical protein